MSDVAVQKRWPESRDGQTSNEVPRSALASRAPGVTLTRLLVASDTLALVLALLVTYVLTSSMALRAAVEPEDSRCSSRHCRPGWSAPTWLVSTAAADGER